MTFALFFRKFVENKKDKKHENRSYQTGKRYRSMEHLLMSCFSIASPEAEDGECLMAMDIFNHLQSKTKEKLALGKLNHLGRVLKKWNVLNKRVGKGSLYYLKKLSDAEKV